MTPAPDGARRATALRWAVAAGWAAVPLTVWPVIADALRGRAHPLHLAVAVAAWVAWAVVLVAALVPHPVGLTTVRCATPAAVGAVVTAIASGSTPGGAAAVAAAWSATVAVVSFLPPVGVAFVNGPAYPNERRFPLAPPVALLFGPIEVAWAVTVGGPTAALVLLASRAWIAGGVVAIVALPASVYLARSLHRLSRRWVVFVPAGLVVHDPMTLGDPILLPRQTIVSLGPAPAGGDALDLTQRALGLALQVRLREEVTVGLVRPGRADEQRATAAMLLTPTRPGAVLAEGGRRRLPVRGDRPGTATAGQTGPPVPGNAGEHGQHP